MINKDPMWVTIRALLIAVGGLLAGLGLATQVDITSFIENAEKVFTGVGSLIMMVTWLWQMWVRWNTRAVPVATAMRLDVPTVSPMTGSAEAGGQAAKDAGLPAS